MAKKKIKKWNSIKAWQTIAYIYPVLATIVGSVLLTIYPMFGFRWFLIGILVNINLLLIALLTLFKTKKMKKAQISTIVILMIFGIGVTFCDYLYYNAIRTMDNISTTAGDKVSSSIYVLSDNSANSLEDLKGKSIAVGSSTSVTMYEMLIEEIDARGMKDSDFVLCQYTSYLQAYEDFTNGTVDAILLDQQAVLAISELYPEFKNTTKIADTFTKIIPLSDVSNIDVSKEPFTILINGVDIRSGNLNEAANADVIMLATFNPQTMKLSLNSIPRDTYLPVTCRGFSDKITHSGSGGVQCTIDSLENAFDINIDYYVKVNFYAVVDLVNALGGIEVDVPFSFTEQDSNDSAGAITLEAGLQTLNGEEALALSRHRKTLPRGDIDRGLNQQLVIEAILRKVASSSGVLNVDKLLKVVGNNVQTNMPTNQMYGLFQMLTNLNSSSKYGDLSALNIQMKTIEGIGNMHVPSYTSLEIYFYMPYDGSIQETTRDINRVLGLESYPLPTNTFAFNANVLFDDLSNDTINYIDNDDSSFSYNTPVVNDHSTSNNYATMPSFSGQSYASIQNWCNSVDNELPEGYYISCQFSSEDGSEISSDATFVSSSVSAGSVLSKNTLSQGSNPIYFVLRNQTVITPDEPNPVPEPDPTPEPNPDPTPEPDPEPNPDPEPEQTPDQES